MPTYLERIRLAIDALSPNLKQFKLRGLGLSQVLKSYSLAN